jgi:YtkA-like
MATPLFWRVSAFSCLIAFNGIACQRSIDSIHDISIQQDISPLPVLVGESVVAVQLADGEANPITSAAIMVEADMTHPGMAPIFRRASEIAPGSYQAKIVFTMAGDWVVLLHIKLADGHRIERQMDVRGVRSKQ